MCTYKGMNGTNKPARRSNKETIGTLLLLIMLHLIVLFNKLSRMGGF